MFNEFIDYSNYLQNSKNLDIPSIYNSNKNGKHRKSFDKHKDHLRHLYKRDNLERPKFCRSVLSNTPLNGSSIMLNNYLENKDI